MATLASGAFLKAAFAAHGGSCKHATPAASSCSSSFVQKGLRYSKFGAKQQGAVQHRGGKGQVIMGIRAIESYDSSFELAPDNKSLLVQLLSSTKFCSQVGEQTGVPPGGVYEFTDLLFQPVPWSPATKHGMPQEFEKYLQDKENYVIVNVPPNYMFQAKIFKPSRLCAIFRKV